MTTNYKIGNYVYAQSTTYSVEGKITSIIPSRGTKRGLLYEVEDTLFGGTHYFFAEDITPLAMPTLYESVTIDMLIRDHWKEDKRLLRMWNNKSYQFTKAKKGYVTISLDALGKHFEHTYSIKEIKHLFATWKLKDKPSWQYQRNPKEFYQLYG